MANTVEMPPRSLVRPVEVLPGTLRSRLVPLSRKRFLGTSRLINPKPLIKMFSNISRQLRDRLNLVGH